jgi:hypothetical protein
MTVIKPSPTQRKRSSLYLGVLLFLVSGLLLSGCFPRQETRKELDFRFALPDTWEVDQVERLDTDGDGENEWVILYAFDDPGNRGTAPIRGAIYDIVRRSPKLPIIYPYHLQAPGWTLLGEGIDKVSVRLEDVVTVAPSNTPGNANEIIVESVGPDGNINRVSIYRWTDTIPPELRKRTDPHEILLVQGRPRGEGEWYQCIGMFAGSLRVNMDQTDRVTVVDGHNDRSQLATFSVYSPKAGQNGYLNANYELAQADSVCINFAHGTPPQLAESPYPEKIVMGYHNTFNKDPHFGADYLTENAQNSRGKDSWTIFGSGTRDVCVKRISYIPAEETVSEVQSFDQANDPTATATSAVPIRALVQTTATYKLPGIDQPQSVQIEWTLVRDPAPQDKPDVWKIDSIREMR